MFSLKGASAIRRISSQLTGSCCTREVILRRVRFSPSKFSSRNLSSSDDKSRSQTGDDTQGWNTYIATAVGVGVIGALGLYWKLQTAEPKLEAGLSTTKKRSWDEEKRMLASVPEKIPYLIIGSGTAAFSAARSIRAQHPAAKVVLIGEEPYLPYMRPPLSKELWLTPTAGDDSSGSVDQPAFLQWNGRPRSIFLEKSQFYCDLKDLEPRSNGGISVGSGIRVVSLNPRKQSVVIKPASDYTHADAPQKEIVYEKCLIATGGKPKTPVAFGDTAQSEEVSLFRNLEDYNRLVEAADRLAAKGGKQAIAVVGGGFLGCELSFALAWRAQQKKQDLIVYQIIRERGVLDNVLPAYLSAWTAEKLAEAGVKLISGVEVSRVEKIKPGELSLKFSNEEKLSSCHVVLATGIEPDTDLAEQAGLEVDAQIGGIAVNSELLARNNIWAAGDVSSFYDPRLKVRRRVEHHDQAIVSGRLAGENMTGAAKVYSQQAMFWSDLGPSISFEAVGLIDSRLQTYAVFAQPDGSKDTEANPEDFKRGIIFYLSTPDLKHGDCPRRLVGMLLWNLPGRIGVARKLLKDQPLLNDLDGGTEKLTEMARIMQITEDYELEDNEESIDSEIDQAVTEREENSESKE